MKYLLTSILLAISVKTFAHGEDKLGPNGGYLKMPGNFHTEVVPSKDGTFKIYLVDINFKEPTVKASKVSVWITNKRKSEIKCEPMKDHFHCFPKGVNLNKGTLTVEAERNSVKGAEAVYKLPLALAKGEIEMKAEDHGSHH